MPLPDQTPPLPKLPFLLADVALLAAAVFIGYRAATPLSTPAIVAVVGCVALAACLGAIPFLAAYARRQDIAFDDRQRSLEALAVTVTTSAEQIGIAASGLHEIVELAHKNLRAADQLPHKLQEKIAEFTAQLANARADDTEELEKSLAELRAAESERLAATAEKIAGTVAELAQLEASAHRHLASANEALAQLTASSSRHFTELATATTAAIARAQTAASTAVDGKLAAAELALATARLTTLSALDAKIEILRATLHAVPASALHSTPLQSAAPGTPIDGPASISAHLPSSEILSSELPAASPLETPSPEPARAPVALEAPPPEPPSVPAPQAPAPRKRVLKKSPETVAAPAPPLPATEPTAVTDEFVQFSPEEIPPPAVFVEPPIPYLELDLSNFETPSPPPASTITNDGATRLHVTAYIGIGNRLFVRGSGPGLSWEKGEPLQFISIGKWRWETLEATTPVTFKLYKNDTVECTSLGEQTLTPGHLSEVTAAF